MANLICPSCGAELSQAGRTDRCPRCQGAWIHEDVLVGILQERASALVVLPWEPRADDQERACAVCRTAMQTVKLGHVALDRCPEHGVWFDPEELASLLAEAKHFKAPEPHHADHEKHHLLHLLARVFQVTGP